MPCCSFATLAFATLLLPAHGDDWPEFRGSTGQGTSTAVGLPVEWSTTKNVVWKQPIPGSGWSSPVVLEGKVYLTTSVAEPEGKGRSLDALCLDAGNGKLLWQTPVFLQDAKASGIHPKNSHASSSPLVHDGRLYVHFGPQGTACLDLGGKVLWRNDRFHYSPVHGNGGSPIVVDNALIFSCDGADVAFVIALDCQTGAQPLEVGSKRKSLQEILLFDAARDHGEWPETGRQHRQ